MTNNLRQFHSFGSPPVVGIKTGPEHTAETKRRKMGGDNSRIHFGPRIPKNPNGNFRVLGTKMFQQRKNYADNPSDNPSASRIL